ncbi:hypothetical protein PCL1606_55540 [Pseudomonas chlororaphis]|uniref:Uncharacterized protein n=1 Tax=Pseudomonas chlororaphis TaxID=587753 RepID=A0A0D5Y7K3_9PSED|nr:hypothetical protein PCL1606_55540 [Pseudomonas chlororaphis]
MSERTCHERTQPGLEPEAKPAAAVLGARGVFDCRTTSRTKHKRTRRVTRNLVPYAGANLIRFNGIRIIRSQPHSKAPRQEPGQSRQSPHRTPTPRQTA